MANISINELIELMANGEAPKDISYRGGIYTLSCDGDNYVDQFTSEPLILEMALDYSLLDILEAEVIEIVI